MCKLVNTSNPFRLFLKPSEIRHVTIYDMTKPRQFLKVKEERKIVFSGNGILVFCSNVINSQRKEDLYVDIIRIYISTFHSFADMEVSSS